MSLRLDVLAHTLPIDMEQAALLMLKDNSFAGLQFVAGRLISLPHFKLLKRVAICHPYGVVRINLPVPATSAAPMGGIQPVRRTGTFHGSASATLARHNH